MDLAELLALPGVKEECVLRSPVGFMALHGGSQDRGTHEIASRAAEGSGASYYAIVQPNGLRLHLPSKHHDPGDSERLRTFLDHVEVAISVHGFGRDSFELAADPVRGLVIEPYGPAFRANQTGPLRGIILGGQNSDLLDVARRLFHDRFDGYYVSDRLRLGFHAHNPVNLPSAQGVQIEIPPGLRGIGDLGERLVPDEDDVIVNETILALVELASRAGQLHHGPGRRSRFAAG